MNSAISSKVSSPIANLQAKRLIAQSTAISELEQHLTQKQRTLYCGFDPTADSLHLGHLVPLLTLRRFQQNGHRPIALVGGATGLIGDPSFKDNERKLNSAEIVASWSLKIQQQLEPFIDFNCGDNSAIVVNNLDWTKSITAIDFLRSIGKYFSVNTMIKRESVQQRINRSDSGISFTEFAYTILQGLDFAELNSRYDCTLEVGGSDQWGNIISGIDLCRKKNQTAVYGLTVPLVTKSDGTKFGKTESGTIWLDPQKTSPYAFYQFWLNTPDADVYNFLNMFTFLSNEEIQQIKDADTSSGKKPEAAKILAEQVTKLVHGKQSLNAANRISNSLFASEFSSLTEQDMQQLQLDGLPNIRISTQDIANKSITQLLSMLDIVKSGKQAKDMLSRKAVFINNKPCGLQDNMQITKFFNTENAMYNRYYLVKTGKKGYFLIEEI